MTIRSVLVLLENHTFCEEAQHVIREIAAFVASPHTGKQRRVFAIKQTVPFVKQTVPFVKKWGVPPPHAGVLVNSVN